MKSRRPQIPWSNCNAEWQLVCTIRLECFIVHVSGTLTHWRGSRALHTNILLMNSSYLRYFSICVRRDGIRDWIPCVSGTVLFRMSLWLEYQTGSRRYVTDPRIARDVSWLVIRSGGGMVYVRSMVLLCLRSLVRRWTAGTVRQMNRGSQRSRDGPAGEVHGNKREEDTGVEMHRINRGDVKPAEE